MTYLFQPISEQFLYNDHYSHDHPVSHGTMRMGYSGWIIGTTSGH